MRQPLSNLQLLRDVRSSALRGDAAIDDDVGHSVAAQAVRAVHAAGDFASSIQARDRLASLGQNLSSGVDLHAAHGVMDARGNLHSVVRSGVQRLGEGHTAKLSIRLSRNSRIPGVQGLGENGSVGAHGSGELLNGVAHHGKALGVVAVVGGGSVHHLLIDDGPGVAALLSELSSGHDVAGLQLVDEALARAVDVDQPALIPITTPSNPCIFSLRLILWKNAFCVGTWPPPKIITS